jgi:crotonobetainyl-CoA:carnitine CoA-transferase CaiB-like acyl-CoA transferase
VKPGDAVHAGDPADGARDSLRGRVPAVLEAARVARCGEAAEVRLPPQRLGAQTAEVLAELGYAPAAIEALARDGVVKLAER